MQWETGDRAARLEGIQHGLDLLETRLTPDAILLTLSEDGVRIRHGGQDDHHPAHPREILDVSGAGDTVIAVATVLLAQGVAHSDLAAAANLAGGLVCEKPGVVPIRPEDLKREIEHLPLHHDLQEFRERINVFLHPLREPALGTLKAINVLVSGAFGCLVAYYVPWNRTPPRH